jgi:hypothetical protein
MAASRILKSLVLMSLSTTVRAMRDSLRDAAQECSASLRIIGSISVNSTSRTNVSSVDRWRVTSYTEVMPRNRLSATWDRSPAKVACVLISSNPVSGAYLPKGRWLRILMLSKLFLLESGTNPVPHDC